MNKFKAVLLLLLVSLGALVGLSNYTSMPATDSSSPSEQSEEQIVVETMGLQSENPRKLYGGGGGGSFFIPSAPPAPKVEITIPDKIDVDNNPKTRLNGKFTMEFPTAPLEITENQFIFDGCNLFRVPYLFQNARLLLGQAVIATKNKCSFDPAALLVQQLSNLRRLSRAANTIEFLDINDNVLFVIIPIRLNPRLASGINFLDLGVYDAELPNFNIQIRENDLTIQGCEDSPIEFTTDLKGAATFRRSIVNGNDCFVGEKAIFNDVFKQTQVVDFQNVRGDKKIEFLDSKGIMVCRCLSSEWK